MFEAALFIIVKTQKKQLCLSVDECIQRLWYIHTKEYYSREKMNYQVIKRHGESLNTYSKRKTLV